MALRSGVKSIRDFRFFANTLKTYSTSGPLINVAVNEKTGVATATLQRPPVNSLNLELLSELSNTLTDLEKNKCRGLILTSACSTVFSAGLDILEMYKPDLNRAKQFWTTVQQVWIKLYGSSYPTVAVLNGHSPAGGCMLAISCEYRIMLNNFTIGLNETQLGIVAPKWFIASMLNTIGRRQTELALTSGKLFKTDEALQVGLIDEVAANKDEAIGKAERFLQKFANISPLARDLTKKSLRGEAIQDLINNQQKDLDNFLANVTQEKVQKGLEIYLESLKQKQKK
ncbi:enoyl-CoA delta isomerase 1, mitochondrial-like [Asbolus verrucosus]|uniref:Enoyl-CoA delta isomerase 1, mitochondrial n=1 Tax=Asbolus verrucosus TaxID=1661398 RepID=A0A482VEU4_ASBVE|nr:enoyl-CoA delta isomerase 1, mitochondrial-like [Asbolus verrucosus]